MSLVIQSSPFPAFHKAVRTYALSFLTRLQAKVRVSGVGRLAVNGLPAPPPPLCCASRGRVGHDGCGWSRRLWFRILRDGQLKRKENDDGTTCTRQEDTGPDQTSQGAYTVVDDGNRQV